MGHALEAIAPSRERASLGPILRSEPIARCVSHHQGTLEGTLGGLDRQAPQVGGHHQEVRLWRVMDTCLECRCPGSQGGQGRQTFHLTKYVAVVCGLSRLPETADLYLSLPVASGERAAQSCHMQGVRLEGRANVSGKRCCMLACVRVRKLGCRVV